MERARKVPGAALVPWAVVALAGLTPLFVDTGCALGLLFPRRLLFEGGAGLLLLATAFGPRRPARAAWLPALLLLGWLLVRIPAAPAAGAGLAVLASAAACCAFGHAAGRAEELGPGTLGRAADALCAAGGAVAALAVVQHLGAWPFPPPDYLEQASGLVGQRRLVYSSLGSPVFVAAFLAPVVPLLVGRQLDRAATGRSAARVLGFVGLALVWAGLVATYCRAGLAAAALGCAVALALAGRSRHRWPVVALSLLAVVGAASVSRYPVGLVERFASTAEGAELGRERRQSEWAAAWWLFTSAPIVGQGPATYPGRLPLALAELYAGAEHARRFHLTSWAHNDYLQGLAEHGLVGAGLAALVVLGLARSARAAAPPPDALGTRAGAAGALAAAAGAAGFYFPLFQPEVLVLLALAAGLLCVGRDAPGPAPARSVPAAVALAVGGCALAGWAAHGYVLARAWGRAVQAEKDGRPELALAELAPVADGAFRYQDHAAGQAARLAQGHWRHDEAARWADLALAVRPLPVDVSVLAAARAALEGPPAGAAAIEPWLRLFPRSGELRANRGVYLIQAGRLDEARRSLQEARAVAPGLFTACANEVTLLALLRARGEATEAEVEAALVEAERAFPERGPALRRMVAAPGP